MVTIGVPDIEQFQPCYDSVTIDLKQTLQQIFGILKEQNRHHIVKVEDRLRCPDKSQSSSGLQHAFEKIQPPWKVNISSYPTLPDRLSPVQAGVEAIQEIERLYPDVDAIFAKNGPQLYGMLAALRTSSRRIPEDLTLITCDNTWLSQYAPVPILAIDQRLKDVSEAAYKMLQSRLHGGEWAAPRHEIIQTVFCDYTFRML